VLPDGIHDLIQSLVPLAHLQCLCGKVLWSVGTQSTTRMDSKSLDKTISGLGFGMGPASYHAVTCPKRAERLQATVPHHNTLWQGGPWRRGKTHCDDLCNLSAFTQNVLAAILRSEAPLVVQAHTSGHMSIAHETGYTASTNTR